MIIEFADIRNVICIDKSALDRLPRAMLERAEWAREALMYPDEHIIEFGRYGDNGYVFAVYNEEDELWFDILGHYHHSSPSEVILGREDRASAGEK